MKRQLCFYILLKLKCVRLCGSYAPIIYSLSLAYNPLEDNNINIKEIFHETSTNSLSSNTKDNIEHEQTTETNTTGSSNTSGSSNSSSFNNGSSLNVASDTPQGQINKEEILQGKYATSTSANESSSEVEDFTNTSSNNTLTNKDVRSDNYSHDSSGNVETDTWRK